MSAKRKSILPRVEIMIIIVFFFSFLMWAVSRCNAKKADYAKYLPQDETVTSADDATDTTVLTQPSPTLPNVATPTVSAAGSSPATGTRASTVPMTRPSTIVASSYPTKLYVTIDGLNVRRGPSLDSAIVVRLPLFEELGFLNEITDFTQEISLGPEIANEPWIRVRTNSGFEGWVYGAGVHYYKKRRLEVE